MGLAAGQARLLTITGRKSDCEFESMRLSHQKIAVARELADLSNEYQNSLTKTKLIYDYYGTGDTNTPLTYSTLMTASKLNDYKPTLVTDALGRVALTSEYAAAAAAAGIPQEGLGCLPSEIVRNQFVQALAAPTVGLITQDMADKITAIPYNQGAGYGNGSVAVTLTEDVTLSGLVDYLDSVSTESVNFAPSNGMTGVLSGYVKGYQVIRNNTGEKLKYSWAFDEGDRVYGCYENDSNGGQLQSEYSTISFGDIIQDYINGKSYYLIVEGQDNRNNTTGQDGIYDNICNAAYWNQMFETFEAVLDTGDQATQLALEYAKTQILPLLTNPSVGLSNYNNHSVGTGWTDEENYDGMNDLKKGTHIARYDYLRDENDGLVRHNIQDRNKNNYIGAYICLNHDNDGSSDNDGCMSAGSINLSAMLMAYLTYFQDAMNGLNATDLYGNQLYNVDKTLNSSTLVEASTMFKIKTGVEVTSDDLAVATFYDTLLNKICMDGWTENDQVEDPEYLQQMLQNGMLYISKAKDDGYYYQGNFSIDTYIKEIDDTQYIAEAEAKYNTEKAKLNSKEETLDMKMKNLDTEMSALTTEYDTVKNTISKNIEKSFKRYSA